MRQLWSRRRFAAAALSFPVVLAACAPAATTQPATPAVAVAAAATAPPATATSLPATPTALPATTTPASTATPVPAVVESTAVPTAPPATAIPPPTATAEPAPTAVASTAPPTTTVALPIDDATTMLTKHWAADMGNVAVLDATALDGTRIALARRGTGYAETGSVTSAEISAGFPFDTLVPSWNVVAPAGTRVQVDLRVRSSDGWSRWYTLGRWGADGGASVSAQRDAMGTVDIDTLRLARPATVFQYRATLSTTNPQSTPSLRLITVNYANMRDGLKGTKPALVAGWAKDLPVPAQSQLLQDSSYARVVCSPTSLSMVLQYWGAKVSVAEVVRGVRDATTRIYGNWPLNAAFAATTGMEAYIDRFYCTEQLQNEIAADRPVVTSIRFGPGELSNATLNSTSGHLIVVRGFTAAGDVIVNDPWAPKLSDVRRVYRRAQFENAWLRPGGIVYLVRPLA